MHVEKFRCDRNFGSLTKSVCVTDIWVPSSGAESDKVQPKSQVRNATVHTRPLHSSPLRSLCSAMAEALVAVLRLAASAAATARPQSRSGRHGSCAARVPCPGPSPFRRGRLCARAAVAGPPEVDDDDAMTIDNLRRFFDVNVGKWNGAFYQFDAHGRVLQGISTRLSVSTYGEDDLISLLQS
jgi:hypothetical protein